MTRYSLARRLLEGWVCAVALLACSGDDPGTGSGADVIDLDADDAGGGDALPDIVGDGGDASACPEPFALCDAVCVDPQLDGVNCGGCGIECGTGEACTAGECQCRPGRTRCGGACVDTASDPTNCGECGTACTGDEVCSSGACALTCDEGLAECDDRCIDTDTDEDHCGACDSPCVADDNQAVTCFEGECDANCLPDFFDLDDEPGCEYACVVSFPDDELCDGADNDCDGRVDIDDDDFERTLCPFQDGVCAGATADCVDGEDDVCGADTYRDHSDGLYQGAVETRCDTVDNDCDGTPDEHCCGSVDVPVTPYDPPPASLYPEHNERLIGVLSEGDAPRLLVLRRSLSPTGTARSLLAVTEFDEGGGPMEAVGTIATDVVDASLSPREDGTFDLAVVRSTHTDLTDTRLQTHAFYRLDAEGAVVWGPESHWFLDGEAPDRVVGIDLHPLPGDDAVVTLQRNDGGANRSITMRLTLGETLSDEVGPFWSETGLWATATVGTDDAGNVTLVVTSLDGPDRTLAVRRFTPPLTFSDERVAATIRSRDVPRFVPNAVGDLVALAGNPAGGVWRLWLDQTDLNAFPEEYGASPSAAALYYESADRVFVATDASDGSNAEFIGVGLPDEEHLYEVTGYIAETHDILARAFLATDDRYWLVATTQDRFEPRNALFAYPLSPELTPLCFAPPPPEE